jgi:hypothetical protein
MSGRAKLTALPTRKELSEMDVVIVQELLRASWSEAVALEAQARGTDGSIRNATMLLRAVNHMRRVIDTWIDVTPPTGPTTFDFFRTTDRKAAIAEAHDLLADGMRALHSINESLFRHSMNGSPVSAAQTSDSGKAQSPNTSSSKRRRQRH